NEVYRPRPAPGVVDRDGVAGIDAQDQKAIVGHRTRGHRVQRVRGPALSGEDAVRSRRRYHPGRNGENLLRERQRPAHSVILIGVSVDGLAEGCDESGVDAVLTGLDRIGQLVLVLCPSDLVGRGLRAVVGRGA
ncbi:hypothetical protein LCGC14_1372490, partial [marine sediment metagenome]